MNHKLATPVLQSSRQRKVPSNDTSCQRLTSNEARPRSLGHTKNVPSFHEKTSKYSLALDDSEGETNCPIRRLCIPEIQGSYFNRIRRIWYCIATRLLEWLSLAQCGVHRSAVVQSMDDQSLTNNGEFCSKSDVQVGEGPSCLNSLIVAWPRLMPHIREAILTLVDAAELVKPALTGDEAAKCSGPFCSGRNYE